MSTCIAFEAPAVWSTEGGCVTGRITVVVPLPVCRALSRRSVLLVLPPRGVGVVTLSTRRYLSFAKYLQRRQRREKLV